jgi:hypothetical protein
MSALTTFLRSREAVLGQRVTIPTDDPHAAFDALCDALGGRYAARQYVADLALVARLEVVGR